jgi:hypothetical protein
MKKWLETNPDAKLPTNQKIEGLEEDTPCISRLWIPNFPSSVHQDPQNLPIEDLFYINFAIYF